MVSPRVLKAGIVDIECGNNVTVIEPSNVYGCSLGDDVFVGPFVEIQKHSVIGPRTKIQSHTFICEYVQLGSDCFIGHGVMFVNDLFKDGEPNANSDSWRKTLIGNNVSIGSNATILPVNICAGCVIGAGCVVTKDITEAGFYAGNPARMLRSL